MGASGFLILWVTWCVILCCVVMCLVCASWLCIVISFLMVWLNVCASCLSLCFFVVFDWLRTVLYDFVCFEGARMRISQGLNACWVLGAVYSTHLLALREPERVFLQF